MNRRAFLKSAAGAALTLAGARLATGAGRRSTAKADGGSRPWGDPRPEYAAGMMPEAARPQRMLELFLMGGLSPWETFYTVPEFCDPSRGGPLAGQQWWTFQDDPSFSVSDWFKGCGGGDAPMVFPYARDAQGVQVNLGPFVYPLLGRPDMLSRMRVWVMRHETEPHESAIPYALTGQGLGTPRLAGFGAHVERYLQEHGGSTLPGAYALFMSTANPGGNHGVAQAVGLHRASSRPVGLQLGASLRLPYQLPRGKVEGWRAELDDVVSFYANRYKKRFSGASGLRSANLDDFVFARDTLARAPELAALLPPALFDVQPIDSCVDNPVAWPPQSVDDDEPSTAMHLATHLLTRPTGGARYVQVLESGLFTDPAGQGYDSHAAHVKQQGTNVAHMCRVLSDIVNRPGEGDPNKLDLDRDFVLLNTEFGRSPTREVTIRNPGGGGTNHWPWGYVVIGFGGFVDTSRAGIVGALAENSLALSGFSPEEFRAAMLLAMGIWPFAPESFAVGDIRHGETELEAALWLRENILGYPA